MYKSPYSVSITEKIAKEVSEGIDAFVMKATVGANITVDRDELLKALAYDRGQYEKGYGDGYQDGKRDAYAWDWISTKERMPDVNQPIMICIFGIYVGEGKYCGHDGYHDVWKRYSDSGTYWDDEVTHWMPLPEPPKEVER